MSIVNTLLEKVVVGPKEEFMAFEKRVPRSSIIQAFQRDTNSVINVEEMKRLKTSQRRPVEIAVMKKKIYRVGGVRQINPTPDVIDSDKVGISWITKEFSFIVADAINQDNYISKAMEMRENMFNAIYSAMYRHPTQALEKNAATFLAANAWAVPPASTVPGVNLGVGSYEVRSEEYVIKAPVVMNELDLFGTFMDIGNIGSLARRRNDATYGKFNQRNIEQYEDEFDYFTSKEVPVTPGAEETHYLVAGQSIGLVNRVEWNATDRTEDKDGQFERITDPFFGFDWGVYVTKARQDMSAQYGVGQERVVGTRFDFAADFAFVNSYSSTPGESPIIKFDGVAS